MKIDVLKKISFVFLVTLLIIISAINILSPKIKTISEREKRILKTFPEFNVKSLFNGAFFEDIEAWFSDNFILREELLDINTKSKKYLLPDTYIKSDDSIVYIPARRSDENFDDEKNDKETIGGKKKTTSDKKISSLSEIKKKNINNQEVVKIEDYMYDDKYEGELEWIGDGYIYYNDAIYSDTSFSLPES